MIKQCSVCGIQKKLECFGKYSHRSDGVRAQCKECRKLEYKTRYVNDKEYFAKYYSDNRERILPMARTRYLTQDRQKLNEYSARTYKKHTALCLARARRHRKNNLGKYAAYARQRIASKLKATQRYANNFAIDEAYDLASRRTASTNLKWHVDHIVPLQSKIVCGLHNEFNVAVIPAIENISKGNRRWPSMP